MDMRVTSTPRFESLAVKAKKGPALNIPAGLETQYIRRWDAIPDKYIIDNFVLEEHRTQKKKVTETVPLFKILIEQLLHRTLLSERDRQRMMDDNDDEEAFEANHIAGQAITIPHLKMILTNFINSEATLALFNSAKVYYIDDMEEQQRAYHVSGSEKIYPCEILLCKEQITYLTDRAIIDKLKKEIYAKISRWRDAKQRY